MEPSRTLLVLGSAGFSKRGIYEAAKRRGLRVVLVKRDPTWEADYCDAILEMNCTNYDDFDRVIPAVVDFANEHDVSGVVTTFDAAIPAVAEVANTLGLVGIAPETAALLRDKALMRGRFTELDLPSATSIAARTFDEVAVAAACIGYPVVVKPTMGTGSGGVMLAASLAQLREAYATAARFSPTGDLVVEEYLDGLEVCVDALVHHGEIVFHNITDNPELMSGPVFPEFEFLTPTQLPHDVAGQVYELSELTLKGLGLTDVIAHTEIRLTSRGPRLIELHPRTAGQRVPEIVQRALGVDLFGAAVDIAMGVRPVIEPVERGYAGYRCVCPDRDGTLMAVDGLDDANRAEGVFDVEIAIPPGTSVRALPDAPQENIAYVFAEGPDYASVRERTRNAANSVRVEIA